MKTISFMFTLFFLFSFPAQANEIVRLKGALSISVCEEMDSSFKCTLDFKKPQDLEIYLKRQSEDQFLSGEHKFLEKKEGFTIEGTIQVTKLEIGDLPPRYLVSSSIASIRGEDYGTLALDYLGSVNLDHPSHINQISFSGGSLRNGKIQVMPDLHLAPANADLMATIQTNHQLRVQSLN